MLGGATTTMTVDYVNDTNLWRIGLVERTVRALSGGTVDCPMSLETVYAPDTAHARPVSVTRTPSDAATRRITTPMYDVFGNVIATMVETAADGTRGAATAYDADGYFAVSTANSLAHVTQMRFDPRMGLLEVSRDPNGVDTQHRFDGFGRPRREERQGEGTVEVTYGPLELEGAHSVTVTSTAGGRQTTRFDRLDRATRVRTTLATRVVVSDATYDRLGRVVSESEPHAAVATTFGVTRSTFDGLGHMRRVDSAETGEVTREWFHPNRRFRQQAAGGVFETRYDTRGLVSRELEPAPAAGATRYSYCANGALRRVLDARGNATEIVYDDLGRRILLDDPSTGMESYTYDAFDQLRTRTDGVENETAHTYDALGREVGRVERLADGSERRLSWSWDTARRASGDLVLGGLASSTTTDQVTDTYAYDDFARMSGVVREVSGQSLHLGIERDAVGRLSAIEYPTITASTAFRVRYAYDDASGEVTEVFRDGDISTWRLVDEDPHGLPTREVLANIDRRTDYSATGRVRGLRATSGATRLQDLAYGYEERGLLRNRSDSIARRTDTFEHDGLGRLAGVNTTAATGATSARYAQDLLGNLTSAHDSRTEFHHTDHPMWATSFFGGSGREDIATDDSGRITSVGRQQYTWNADDLPRSIRDPAVGTVSFAYAPDGERARKSGKTETLYLGGLFEREQSELNVVERYYVPTPAGVVSVVERAGGPGGAVTSNRWLLTDRQGSVETEWQEGTASPVHIRYDAYGGVLDSRGRVTGQRPQAEVSEGYTGHEHDGDLGLVNMNGRMYSPRLRRFLTADPLVTTPRGQGLNRYAYVLNAPMDFTDPSGWTASGSPIGVRAS